MSMIICIANKAQDIFDKVRSYVDFIGPLLLRIYIVPVFWVASNNKWNPFDSESSLDSVIQWFDNGLGLPFPTLMAYMAWGAEYFGAILLALGLATRWISIPLMGAMIVAAITVHWQHGWQAVHDLSSPHASANTGEAIERLDRAKSILQEHGHYDWLTEHGNFVVSNSGIEWAATYFVILLALFVTGGGKFISVDYWLAKKFRG
jgi:putative oxidoreductase